MAAHRRSGKLAVILHADVAGSTALVQQDEHLAHERIQDSFRRFGDTIGKYHGRVRELRGDALLAEFERASDAVTATLAFQANQSEYNTRLNDNIRPTVRVGIALGEVVIADNTVTGTGVVLAQRVEQLANPGSVCITAAIHEALPQRMPFDQESLGEQQVKGFDEPIRVYRVELSPGQSIPPPQESTHEASPKTRRLIVSVAAIALVVAGGATYWFKPWEPREEPASIDRMAFPLPDKPSIAVLPFDNLSSDPNQEYFSDGLTEDIITNLSRFPDLFVIARHSTVVYKGKSVTVKQVAEELGVNYLLEGSVQTAGDKVRITAQLIDATTGHHLWAEDYDRELDDIFAVRDEVTASIVATLMGSDYAELRREELKRLARSDPANLDAYQQVLAAIDIWLHFTKEANAEAKQLLKKAIELDPKYPRAYIVLAWVYLNEYRYQFSDDPEQSLEQAFELALKSIDMDDADSWSHWALGVVYLYQGNYDESIVEYDKALTRNPNDADVFAHMGMPLTFSGEPERAIEQLKRAMRLNPNYPPWYSEILGLAYVSARQYKAAIAPLKEHINRIPGSMAPHRSLAIAYAYLGQEDEAHNEIETILNIDPKLSIEGVKLGLPFRHEADLDHFIDGLRKAGLPEQPPLPLPDKPSIAVLPFANMSDDAQQEYFVDGMTEDLITDLSKISGLFVIARNSTFKYKGKAVPVKQVAEEMGVRYVLEGSVRRAGGQVRINAQLIDAKTGGHVWAERYDRNLDNIFTVQDSITERVVQALELHLTDTEQKDRDKGPKTTSLEAYDLVLKARKLMTRFDYKAAAKARDLLQRAIEIDPAYTEAHSLLGFYYFDEWRVWGRKRDQNLSRALELATTAVELGPSDPAPHVLLALVYQWRREFEAANSEADTALALQPNDAITLSNLGSMLNWAGRSEEALGLLQQAVRLDPFHPPNYLERLADAYAGVGDYDQCIEVAKRGVALDPNYVGLHVGLAACGAALGRQEDAQAAAAAILRTNPRFTLQAFASYVPFSDERDLQRKVKMLRQAGVPDSADEVFRTPEGHMTGEQIRAAISGQTFVETRPVRFTGTISIYDPSGIMSGHPQAGSPAEQFGSDQGKWWTEGDKFCRKWTRWQSGRTGCFSFVSDGNSITWIDRYGQFHSEMEKLD